METTDNNFTNKTTLYHFIIDRSGSMRGMENMVVGGYNEHISGVKNLQATYPDQKFLMSLTVFDHEITTLVHPSPIEALQELPADAFTPRGSTALLDAIGKSIHLIESEFTKAIQNDEMSVVTIIITDGEENCSQFFSYEAIAKQIKERDETGKWTFSFIGCDFDALNISERLNIRRENVRNFEKRNYDIMSGFMDDSMARYAESKSNGSFKKRVLNFFSDEDSKF
jgi:uncharacterized protein YegL